jgi:hypothetical protein
MHRSRSAFFAPIRPRRACTRSSAPPSRAETDAARRARHLSPVPPTARTRRARTLAWIRAAPGTAAQEARATSTVAKRRRRRRASLLLPKPRMGVPLRSARHGRALRPPGSGPRRSSFSCSRAGAAVRDVRRDFDWRIWVIQSLPGLSLGVIASRTRRGRRWDWRSAAEARPGTARRARRWRRGTRCACALGTCPR